MQRILVTGGGTLDFDLPQTLARSATRKDQPAIAGQDEPGFVTEAEYERPRRENLLAVLN